MNLLRKMFGACVLLGLSGCSAVSFLAANIPATFEKYRSTRDVAYGPLERQRLDVYVPSKPAAAKAPVVVFLHGGRWTFGEKEQYKFVGAALAGRGMIAVLPNYRLYPQAKLAEFGADAAAAVAWAREHAGEYGGDPQQLFVMGHSAGAHLAVLITLDQHYLRDLGVPANALAGTIGMAGPYDFLPFEDADIRDMFGPPERYELSQPIHFVRADAPPMLLMHGTSDQTVWIRNTRNLSAVLQNLGAPVAARYYDGLGHGGLLATLSVPLRGRAPVLDEIEQFVRRQ